VSFVETKQTNGSIRVTNEDTGYYCVIRKDGRHYHVVMRDGATGGIIRHGGIWTSRKRALSEARWVLR